MKIEIKLYKSVSDNLKHSQQTVGRVNERKIIEKKTIYGRHFLIKLTQFKNSGKSEHLNTLKKN